MPAYLKINDVPSLLEIVYKSTFGASTQLRGAVMAKCLDHKDKLEYAEAHTELQQLHSEAMNQEGSHDNQRGTDSEESGSDDMDVDEEEYSDDDEASSERMISDARALALRKVLATIKGDPEMLRDWHTGVAAADMMRQQLWHHMYEHEVQTETTEEIAGGDEDEGAIYRVTLRQDFWTEYEI